MKKGMLIVMIILLIFATLFSLMFGGDILLSMPWNKQKAADVAGEYLKKNYQRDMQYIKTNYPPINFYNRPYTVFFSPVDIPDLVFQVKINKAFELPEKQPVSNNSEFYFSPDNYYLTYFEYNINKPLQKHADEMQDTEIRIASSTNDGFGNFKTPYIFNEQMAAEEMEKYLEYVFYISIDRILDKSSEGEEALRMLQMIEFIKNNDNTPERILFWYKTGKDEKHKVVTDLKTWPELYIEFVEWQKFVTVEQIVDEIDRQWE